MAASLGTNGAGYNLRTLARNIGRADGNYRPKLMDFRGGALPGGSSWSQLAQSQQRAVKPMSMTQGPFAAGLRTTTTLPEAAQNLGLLNAPSTYKMPEMPAAAAGAGRGIKASDIQGVLGATQGFLPQKAAAGGDIAGAATQAGAGAGIFPGAQYTPMQGTVGKRDTGLEMAQSPESLEDLLKRMMQEWFGYGDSYYNQREDELWKSGERELAMLARQLRDQAGLRGIGSSGYLDTLTAQGEYDIGDKIRTELAQERQFNEQMKQQYGEMAGAMGQWLLGRGDQQIPDYIDQTLAELEAKRATGDWTEEDQKMYDFLTEQQERSRYGGSLADWMASQAEGEDIAGTGAGETGAESGRYQQAALEGATKTDYINEFVSAASAGDSIYTEDDFMDATTRLIDTLQALGWSDGDIRAKLNTIRLKSKDKMADLYNLASTVDKGLASDMKKVMDAREKESKVFKYDEVYDWASKGGVARAQVDKMFTVVNALISAGLWERYYKGGTPEQYMKDILGIKSNKVQTFDAYLESLMNWAKTAGVTW